jgi:2-oxoglutarate dehydrogenase E2 component (dihydrolipoamide succinyltransferase)
MSTPIRIPAVAESITEVMIAEWLVQDGQAVQLDTPLILIETDKASMEVVAEVAGVVKITTPAGTVVPVGAEIGQLVPGEAGAVAPAPTANPASPAASPAPVAGNASGHAAGHPSPAAQVALKAQGISPAQVTGSGRDGRITKADALAAQPAATPSPAHVPVATPTASPAAVAAESSDNGESRQKMSMLRRKLAERLVNVKNQTAMLTTFNEVDMSSVMAVRAKYKDAFKEKHGVNLGFMSFFTKAVTMALEAWPAVNARIEGDEIVYNRHANVGIAVSTPKGLVVPVLRKSEQLSLAGIEATIADYAKKARDGKIAITDMEGGTFTITNGGVFGSLMSTPIINPPQSAILGMHNIVQRPVAVDGKVEIRPMMYLALSYDHRIIDGRESVSFLKMVKDILEDPNRFLMGF